MYSIGIDLGGTNIAVGVVDSHYHIIQKGSIPTRAQRSADEITADIAALCRKVVSDASLTLSDMDFVGINTTNGLINQVQSIARAESITISNIDNVARQLNDSMFHIIKSVMERKASTFNF